MDVTNSERILTLITTPLYIFFIGLEMLVANFKDKKWYDWKDVLNNILMGGLNVLIDLVVRVTFGLFLLHYFQRFAFLQWSEKNWWYWVSLFVLQDFFYYLIHVLEHRVRIFWAVHNIHHSSEFFNFTVALRSSIFQPIYKFPFYIPLVILGYEALDILLVYALGQVYGFFVHSSWIQRWWGILEKIMVSPSHHRVHHAKEPEYIDRNMAMVFIVWDKLFGTFTPENTQKPISFGITKPINSNNPFVVIFHEWKAIVRDVRQADSLRDKLIYIFGPPGWKPQEKKQTNEIETETVSKVRC